MITDQGVEFLATSQETGAQTASAARAGATATTSTTASTTATATTATATEERIKMAGSKVKDERCCSGKFIFFG